MIKEKKLRSTMNLTTPEKLSSIDEDYDPDRRQYPVGKSSQNLFWLQCCFMINQHSRSSSFNSYHEFCLERTRDFDVQAILRTFYLPTPKQFRRFFTVQSLSFKSTPFEKDLILLIRALMLDKYFDGDDTNILPTQNLQKVFDKTAMDFFKNISFFNIFQNGDRGWNAVNLKYSNEQFFWFFKVYCINWFMRNFSQVSKSWMQMKNERDKLLENKEFLLLSKYFSQKSDFDVVLGFRYRQSQESTSAKRKKRQVRGNKQEQEILDCLEALVMSCLLEIGGTSLRFVNFTQAQLNFSVNNPQSPNSFVYQIGQQILTCSSLGFHPQNFMFETDLKTLPLTHLFNFQYSGQQMFDKKILCCPMFSIYVAMVFPNESFSKVFPNSKIKTIFITDEPCSLFRQNPVPLDQKYFLEQLTNCSFETLKAMLKKKKDFKGRKSPKYVIQNLWSLMPFFNQIDQSEIQIEPPCTDTEEQTTFKVCLQVTRCLSIGFVEAIELSGNTSDELIPYSAQVDVQDQDKDPNSLYGAFFECTQDVDTNKKINAKNFMIECRSAVLELVQTTGVWKRFGSPFIVQTGSQIKASEQKKVYIASLKAAGSFPDLLQVGTFALLSQTPICVWDTGAYGDGSNEEYAEPYLRFDPDYILRQVQIALQPYSNKKGKKGFDYFKQRLAIIRQKHFGKKINMDSFPHQFFIRKQTFQVSSMIQETKALFFWGLKKKFPKKAFSWERDAVVNDDKPSVHESEDEDFAPNLLKKKKGAPILDEKSDKTRKLIKHQKQITGSLLSIEKQKKQQKFSEELGQLANKLKDKKEFQIPSMPNEKVFLLKLKDLRSAIQQQSFQHIFDDLLQTPSVVHTNLFGSWFKTVLKCAQQASSLYDKACLFHNQNNFLKKKKDQIKIPFSKDQLVIQYYPDFQTLIPRCDYVAQPRFTQQIISFFSMNYYNVKSFLQQLEHIQSPVLDTTIKMRPETTKAIAEMKKRFGQWSRILKNSDFYLATALIRNFSQDAPTDVFVKNISPFAINQPLCFGTVIDEEFLRLQMQQALKVLKLIQWESNNVEATKMFCASLFSEYKIKTFARMQDKTLSDLSIVAKQLNSEQLLLTLRQFQFRILSGQDLLQYITQQQSLYRLENQVLQKEIDNEPLRKRNKKYSQLDWAKTIENNEVQIQLLQSLFDEIHLFQVKLDLIARDVVFWRSFLVYKLVQAKEKDILESLQKKCAAAVEKVSHGHLSHVQHSDQVDWIFEHLAKLPIFFDLAEKITVEYFVRDILKSLEKATFVRWHISILFNALKKVHTNDNLSILNYIKSKDSFSTDYDWNTSLGWDKLKLLVSKIVSSYPVLKDLCKVSGTIKIIFDFAANVLFPELLKQQSKEEILVFLQEGTQVVDKKNIIEENFHNYFLNNLPLLAVEKRVDEQVLYYEQVELMLRNIEEGKFNRAIWLTGQSGVGKSFFMDLVLAGFQYNCIHGDWQRKKKNPFGKISFQFQFGEESEQIKNKDQDLGNFKKLLQSLQDGDASYKEFFYQTKPLCFISSNKNPWDRFGLNGGAILREIKNAFITNEVERRTDIFVFTSQFSKYLNKGDGVQDEGQRNMHVAGFLKDTTKSSIPVKKTDVVNMMKSIDSLLKLLELVLILIVKKGKTLEEVDVQLQLSDVGRCKSIKKMLGQIQLGLPRCEVEFQYKSKKYVPVEKTKKFETASFFRSPLTKTDSLFLHKKETNLGENQQERSFQQRMETQVEIEIGVYTDLAGGQTPTEKDLVENVDGIFD